MLWGGQALVVDQKGVLTESVSATGLVLVSSVVKEEQV
jgi:hypothetical protein